MEKIGDEVRDISDEIPFDIPESWEWCRLGSIGETNIGLTYKPSDKVTEAEGIAVLRSNNIQSGKMDYSDMVYVSCNVPERAMINKGDILICARNGSRALVGKSAIVDVDGMAFGAFMAKYTSVFSGLLNKYILTFIESPIFRKQLDGVKTETINQITQDMIKEQLIPIPPIAEQSRINQKLLEIMPYIEKYDTTYSEITKLNGLFPDLLKKAILQQAVQGKLVPQNPDDEPASVLLERIRAEKQELIRAGKIKKDKNESVIFRRDNSHYEMVNGVERCIDDEIPFEVPENWGFTRLFTICIKDVKRGKSPKYGKNNNVLVFAQKCNTKSGDIKLDLAQGLDNDAFNKYPSDEIMCDNDIIVNSTGTGTLGRIGFYTKSDNPTNALVVPDSHVTVVRITNSVDSKFIYHCLKYYQPILEEQGEGSTNQKELKPYTISNLIIPIPPMSEQQLIVEKIEEIIPFITTL